MENDALDLHNHAVVGPQGFEILIVLIRDWESYAAIYHRKYETQIGEDAVLGAAWIDIGKCFIDLLNGDIGRLDAGTLDARIRRSILAAGFTQEELDT